MKFIFLFFLFAIPASFIMIYAGSSMRNIKLNLDTVCDDYFEFNKDATQFIGTCPNGDIIVSTRPKNLETGELITNQTQTFYSKSGDLLKTTCEECVPDMSRKPQADWRTLRGQTIGCKAEEAKPMCSRFE